ncbi:MAG: polyprenyl synthetase family protein [Clostridia bacterium]|nr:polyprenyl synthetase family protein [Clostridia bacterium]
MENRDFTALKTQINANAEAVENALTQLCSRTDDEIGLIYDAQRYSLLGGGKRVRPFIVNQVCKILGGSIEESMPLACAIEMIHCYSLVHDDLPCMDDDDVRRGKPSNHKQFGYAHALLAGDALLTNAFATIAEAESLSAEKKVEAIKILAHAAGDCGMIGGQIMDLYGETAELEFEQLIRLHSMKTGALIRCSALLGCLAAGYAPDSDEAVRIGDFAKKVGVAFQVVDDVLDEIADEKELGKSVGSDAGHNKTTFLTYYSAEEAMKYARRLTDEAVAEISDIKGYELLADFAYCLLERNN